MPAASKFLIQSLQPGIKDPMHALDFGLLAGSTIARAESARPTPATMENLLRKALATTEPNEICFVHFPPEEISFSPEAQEHIDECTFSIPAIETDCDGLVYSLTKETFQYIQQECLPQRFSSLPTCTWTLISIVPCAERKIFSVAVPSSRAHTRQDRVFATYVPGQAASTVGMTIVHFFS